MKIGMDEIMYIKALESIAGVSAADCLIDKNTIIFLVSSNQIGAVIGKDGSTIKRIRQRMKKNVEIFEYTPTAKEFLKKALYNIKINEINVDKNGAESTVGVKLDSENRKLLMLNSGRLKRIRNIMKRSYGIENLRIR